MGNYRAPQILEPATSTMTLEPNCNFLFQTNCMYFKKFGDFHNYVGVVFYLTCSLCAVVGLSSLQEKIEFWEMCITI